MVEYFTVINGPDQCQERVIARQNIADAPQPHTILPQYALTFHSKYISDKMPRRTLLVLVNSGNSTQKC